MPATYDNDPGGPVLKADGGIGDVLMLSTGTACPEGSDAALLF
jgi:hypothetical protein